MCGNYVFTYLSRNEIAVYMAFVMKKKELITQRYTFERIDNIDYFPMSRNELEKRTHINAVTCRRIAKALCAAGLLMEGKKANEKYTTLYAFVENENESFSDEIEEVTFLYGCIQKHENRNIIRAMLITVQEMEQREYDIELMQKQTEVYSEIIRRTKGITDKKQIEKIVDDVVNSFYAKKKHCKLK